MIHEDSTIPFDIHTAQTAIPAGLGPNVIAPSLPAVTAWPMSLIQPNYELGLNSERMKRALAVNVSAFAMRYKDMQVSSVEKLPSGQPQVVTGNAATARINGIETELNWRLSKMIA